MDNKCHIPDHEYAFSYIEASRLNLVLLLANFNLVGQLRQVPLY